MAKLDLNDLDNLSCNTIGDVTLAMPDSCEIFPLFYDTINHDYLTLDFRNTPYALSNKEFVVYGINYQDEDFNSDSMGERLYSYPWTEVNGRGGNGYGAYDISEHSLLLIENLHNQLLIVSKIEHKEGTPIFHLTHYKDTGYKYSLRKEF